MICSGTILSAFMINFIMHNPNAGFCDAQSGSAHCSTSNNHILKPSSLIRVRPFTPHRLGGGTNVRCSQQSTTQPVPAPQQGSTLQPSLTTAECYQCIARRALLLAGPLAWVTWRASAAHATSGSEPASIRLDLAPDQAQYNAADERLRDAAGRLQLALNAEDVKVRAAACTIPHLPPLSAPPL